MLVKKKRGRPKKLILDPSTKQYIDSSHPRFKQLNKLLKESSSPSTPNSDGHESGKTVTHVTHLSEMDEEEVKELLKRKDRRGRPRKFPIEETGLTIKGIRVNGATKNRRVKTDLYVDSTDAGNIDTFGVQHDLQNLNREPIDEQKMPLVALTSIDAHVETQPVKFKEHLSNDFT